MSNAGAESPLAMNIVQVSLQQRYDSKTHFCKKKKLLIFWMIQRPEKMRKWFFLLWRSLKLGRKKLRKTEEDFNKVVITVPWESRWDLFFTKKDYFAKILSMRNQFLNIVNILRPNCLSLYTLSTCDTILSKESKRFWLTRKSKIASFINSNEWFTKFAQIEND